MIINNLKRSDTGKIQLTVAINFSSSKDNDEERLMDSKGDNIEIIISDKVDEVKATLSPINNNKKKFFQHTVKVPLNHEEIKKDLERITKIKSF